MPSISVVCETCSLQPKHELCYMQAYTVSFYHGIAFGLKINGMKRMVSTQIMALRKMHHHSNTYLRLHISSVFIWITSLSTEPVPDFI